MLPPGSFAREAVDLLVVALGAAIIGLAFQSCILPAGIAASGVLGLAAVLHQARGWDPALVQAAISLPLLALGGAVMGWAFLVRAALGTLLVPVAILCAEGIPVLTAEPALCAVYGGLGIGVGLGMMLLGRGSAGGFSVLALLAARWCGVTPGKALLVGDVLVLGVASLLLPMTAVLWAGIAAWITNRVADALLTGWGSGVQAWIITERHQLIREHLLTHLGRGLTVLEARGGLTDAARPVLLVVCDRGDLVTLKRTVAALDPEAFLVVAPAIEVLGQGFRGLRS
jgi:uncharacterized membrane-anchored protein YitT (DUF2179 family)